MWQGTSKSVVAKYAAVDPDDDADAEEVDEDEQDDGTEECPACGGEGEVEAGPNARAGRVLDVPREREVRAVSDPFLLDTPAAIHFSGGRTSAYMLRRHLDAYGGTLPEGVRVVFCNTGKERPS